MNIYFIYVIVHVQMWCVCAQPYVDQIKKIFCSFCLLLEVICITHIFQSFLSCFCVKNMFSGCFHDLYHELAQLGVKWSNFKVFLVLDREFRDCFASSLRVRLTNEKFYEYFRESASRKNFQINFLKGILWVICFKRLPSSPKPLF